LFGAMIGFLATVVARIVLVPVLLRRRHRLG
jgi:hypothetical protein